uniref:Glycosyl transferase, group 1 n=1 Tax=Rheinheimera sp. BAL341 TaxID=1708203 RepID=A0A486XV44_9GAMM
MSCTRQTETIYVNIAATLRFGGITGIQRVVRKLFDELHQTTVGNLTFVFGANTPKGCYTAAAEDLIPISAGSESQLGKLTLFQRLPFPIKSGLRTFYRRYIARDAYGTKHLIKIPKNAWELELDSPWIDDWRQYPQFRNTINLLYDVTPLSHGEYCQPEASYLFVKWLKHNLPKSRGIISISQASLCCILTTLQRNNISFPSNCRFFYLGSNLTNKPLSLTQQSNPYFLFVGSIAPQKNISLLLEAYTECRTRGGDWPLVVLGRSAGFNQLERRIIALSDLGIVWLNNAKDNDLQQTYAACSVVIAPSVWEGFGLPLVEALSFQKTVIASDIEVYKELAAGAFNFFDVTSVASLAKRMQEAEQGGLYRSDGSNIPGLLNWQQSAFLFADAVFQILKEITQIEDDL